jgi:hypothetical protein
MLDVAPAEAQRVSADIHIGGRGPVAGTIHIGDRYERWDRRVVRRGPYRRAAVVRRDFPRRILVETFPGKSYRRNLRRAQIVTAYYDRDCGLFFDRPFRGLREVQVYRYNGRYYPMNDRLDRDRIRRDRDGDRDRDRRYDRDRDRDRRYDRDDDYGNGRWEHEH